MSEKVLRAKALAKYPRASYHLASKTAPAGCLKCDEDVPPYFLTSSWPTAALITLIFYLVSLCA